MTSNEKAISLTGLGIFKEEIDILLGGKVNTSDKGANNGVATLGEDGKVPSSQLPSFVDDVIEGFYKEADGKFYKTKSGDIYSNEIASESGKIYIDISTSKTYRWSGSVYAEISESIALGETQGTAYEGSKGKANADAISGHTGDTNIHVTAQNKTAWDAKYDKPSTGIPSTDFASAVTTSLGKADSAIQSIKVNGTALTPDSNKAVDISIPTFATESEIRDLFSSQN